MRPSRRDLLVSAAALAAMPGAALAKTDGDGLRVIRVVDGDSVELADGARRAVVARGARFGRFARRGHGLS